MKRCSRCKTEKTLDQFGRDRQTPDGLNRRCRDCKRELKREDWSRHRDARAAYHQEWQKTDQARATKAAWIDANRDLVNEQARAWRTANHEGHLASKRKWRESNADTMRAYRVANLDRHAERSRRRRALQVAATIGPVDLDALWDEQGGLCALCGDPIDRELRAPHPMSKSVDHIVPLSKGGTHEQSNLQWTHLVENIQKGARVPAANAVRSS